MGTPFPAGPQPALDGPSDLTIVRPAGAEPLSPDTTSPVHLNGDLAEADRIRRQRPRSLLRLTLSRIGLRRWPWMSRRAVRALIAEQDGISAPHDPAHATYGEVVVHSIARRRSTASPTRVPAPELDEPADRSSQGQAGDTPRPIGLIPRTRPHPHGGHRTVEQTKPTERPSCPGECQPGPIPQARRLPRWSRQLPRVVLAFDFLLLLYFLSGITDVNWGNPESPAAGVRGRPSRDDHDLVSYGCFAFAGNRLRAHKEHSGRIPPGSLDWLTRMLVVACTVGIIVLGLLMFSRMWSEVLVALGNGATTTAISVAAAVTAVSVLANVMVILGARPGWVRGDRPARCVRRRGSAFARPGRPDAAARRPPRPAHRGPRPEGPAGHGRR